MDEDDMVIVIVGDEGGETDLGEYPELISKLQNVKQEPTIDNEEQTTDNEYCEYLEESYQQLLQNLKGDLMDAEKPEIKIEIEYEEEQDNAEYLENAEYNSNDFVYGNDNEYPDEVLDENADDPEYKPGINYADSHDDEPEDENLPKRYSMVQPWQRNSFVKDLKQKYPELKKTEELVKTLAEIMRNVQKPDLPKDHYISIDDNEYQCSSCGAVRDTIPAVGRHYAETHGPRYLVCYACGVDFRSKTNLLKHEKRCVAPDAVIVLKARALMLGRKGRSRPYLPPPSKVERYLPMTKKFPCDQCSGVYSCRATLDSHKNLHNGIRPYMCHACDAAYTSPLGLKRHLQKHDEKKYICDHCQREFKIKECIVQHMNTHREVKKYGCTECEKRFASNHALKLHVDGKHLNLPFPCVCNVCNKRFRRMSVLRTHMKRAHGMDILTRKMFMRKLPTMSVVELQYAKVFFNSVTTEKSQYVHT